MDTSSKLHKKCTVPKDIPFFKIENNKEASFFFLFLKKAIQILLVRIKKKKFHIFDKLNPLLNLA